MKAVQKIVVNGCSAQVTIPRKMMFEQQLRPGDFVEIESDELGGFTIRPWVNRQNRTVRSPGIIADRPEGLKR